MCFSLLRIFQSTKQGVGRETGVLNVLLHFVKNKKTIRAIIQTIAVQMSPSLGLGGALGAVGIAWRIPERLRHSCIFAV